MATPSATRLRQQRADLRQGGHWYYADPAAYQDHGVMIFHPSLAADTAIIAVKPC